MPRLPSMCHGLEKRRNCLSRHLGGREGWFEGQSTTEIWIRGVELLNCGTKRSRPDSPGLTLLQLLLTLASRRSQLRKNISTILIRGSSRMIRPLSTTRDHSRGSLGNRESQELGKG